MKHPDPQLTSVSYDNFIIVYGFLQRLHSDGGSNFESSVIRELCEISGIEKPRSKPYNAMEIGGC